MKFVKRVLFVFLLFIAIYLTIGTLIARNNTVDIVKEAFDVYGSELILEELTNEQIEILLQVEDPNFNGHNGIDLKTNGAGLTTITQGMVKYLYFDEFKPGIAKLRQSLIAVFALDAKISKDEQLRLFINSMYMGTINDEPINGFAEASHAYFDKEFSQLTEDEYIQLVAMIIGPDFYNPIKNAEALEERVSRINKLLQENCEPADNRDVYYKDCL